MIGWIRMRKVTMYIYGYCVFADARVSMNDAVIRILMNRRS